MNKIAVLMDPIENLDPSKDTTICLIEHLGKFAEIYYIFPNTISYKNSSVIASIARITINRKISQFYKLSKFKEQNLDKMDVILFRKDPPVNDDYLNVAHILQRLESDGKLIMNSPSSIMMMNEKILGDCYSPNRLPSIITNNYTNMEKFIKKHHDVVAKPLNMMAGKLIQKINVHDRKFQNKLLHTQNNNKDNFIILQKYLDIHKYGDMRIIVYNGKVYKRCLLRFPKKTDFRANLACGGKFFIKDVPKSLFDHLTIVAEILLNNGIYFAGIDIIGKYMTEINITSPTGLVELTNENDDLSTEIARDFIKVIDDHKE